jgi:hypothetical protein
MIREDFRSGKDAAQPRNFEPQRHKDTKKGTKVGFCFATAVGAGLVPARFAALRCGPGQARPLRKAARSASTLFVLFFVSLCLCGSEHFFQTGTNFWRLCSMRKGRPPLPSQSRYGAQRREHDIGRSVRCGWRASALKVVTASGSSRTAASWMSAPMASSRASRMRSPRAPILPRRPRVGRRCR